ncbi:16S rRNA processing protein RimM [Gracilibacillus boraciitolerans JCM 21714]|uniref:Ribosome maturation factor RimM n=1 Tax=Gracilibacillus boraciitolerans JCM 21714 TaxID=1298598 RepID=W4VFQ5_9BACI|nr:ribosome maturation factor RimM [Gracilibacillus boraciitolerans]GAE91653.1 16S rRNA processing protein RimM [Gracilibacillus boraciitolerans JCM 21714]
MEHLKVGKIVNTHGIKGEIKVLRITDFEERFQAGTTLWIQDSNNNLFNVKIDGHRIHKNFDLLHFEGYDNINDVEPFKGMYLFIKKEDITELEDNAFYYHEIIGCTVETMNGEHIGNVTEILSPGANDVWVVKNTNGKEFLIPYIEQVVKEVDLQTQLIKIEPMEGLFE